MEVTEVPRAIIALLPSPRAWKGTVHTEGLRQTLRHLVGWQGSAALRCRVQAAHVLQ